METNMIYLILTFMVAILLIETNHPQSLLPKIYKILKSLIIKNQSYNLESKSENNNNPFFKELNYNISNFFKINNFL